MKRDLDERCPRCDSPDPARHPAMQWEGEVQPCPHPWHEERQRTMIDQALLDDLRSLLGLGMGDGDDGWNDVVTDQIDALLSAPWVLAQLAIDSGGLELRSHTHPFDEDPLSTKVIPLYAVVASGTDTETPEFAIDPDPPGLCMHGRRWNHCDVGGCT